MTTASTGVQRRLGWILLPTALALVLGLIALSYARPASGVHETSTTTVMVVGDSISQGSAGDWTWRYRFATHLAAVGSPVVMVGPRNYLYDNVAGQQGDTHYADTNFHGSHDAVWGRRLGEAARTIRSEVATARPDYLLLLMGINDIMSADRTPAQTATDLRLFIRESRVAEPDVRLVIGTVMPALRHVDDPRYAKRVDAYNRLLRGVADDLATQRSPIKVAESAADIHPDLDLYDGLHPNARGEVKIAAAFVDAIAEFGVGHPYPRPLPSPPIGPTTAPALVIHNGTESVTLSWAETPGATSYRIWMRQADVAADDYRQTQSVPSGQDPFVVTGLESGVRYAFKLQPVKGHAAGVFSAPAIGGPLGDSLAQSPVVAVGSDAGLH